ncbi:MAG: hypothetical protein JL56_11450 [Desulfotomaculum sp. BICA1-6]|nr:MAG: hypothetical protein VR67_18265 [Peptococcaceae bacterium BRH_c8a]KJS73316.1 MAG: hypothetical protein JL56_11450 [Desulfotomaculum sp. BICA1-6]
MNSNDPGVRYRKGMSYQDKVNLSYDLEQDIEHSKQKLSDLRNNGTEGESAELSKLEERITKSERLRQTVQNDIHGINAGRLQ